MKFTVSLCLFFLFFQINAQENWTLEKDQEGIKVYTRHKKGFVIKEFKAITYTSKSISELEEILEDVENYPNWVYSVSSGKLIKELGNDRTLYYSLDLPWPVSDRDIVIQSVKSKDNGLRYDMTATQGGYPDQSGLVRMTSAFGSWQFIPKDGKIEITYQFYGNPAGSIPTWMINMLIVDGPFETLKKLR